MIGVDEVVGSCIGISIEFLTAAYAFAKVRSSACVR